MAKMQGFGGGADATLVSAATRAAFANVPKDLSGIFNNIAQSYAQGMSDLGAGIAKAAEAAGTAYAAAKAEAEKQDETVQSGGVWFENGKEDIQKQLEDIKEERKGIRGETDFLSKERREQIRANRRKEDKIYSELAKLDNTMNDAKASFIEGGLDHILMGEDSNNFFSTFFAGGGDVKNAKGDVIGKTKIDFDDEGKVQVSFLDGEGKVKLNKYGKPMQGDVDFVKSLMVMKDPKTKENAAKITQLLYNTGKAGGKWNENTQNQLRNNLDDLINETTVGGMLRERFGTQEKSFHDALTSVNTKESAQMFNLLNNQFQFTDKSLDVTGPKGKPDGKIDAKDFEADAKKFIDVLTDKNHPHYDPSATKRAYIDFLVDGEGKAQWKMGNDIYLKNLPDDNTGKLTPNTSIQLGAGVYAKYGQMEAWKGDLERVIKDGKGVVSINLLEKEVELVDNQWFINGQPTSFNQVLGETKIGQYFPKLYDVKNDFKMPENEDLNKVTSDDKPGTRVSRAWDAFWE